MSLTSRPASEEAASDAISFARFNPADVDGELAKLHQRISSARDEIERCVVELQRLSDWAAQMTRSESVGSGTRFQASPNVFAAGTDSPPLGARSRAPKVDTRWTEVSPFGAIDTAGVAALLGCTREHATNRVTKMPGFPKLVVNLSQKARAWDRDEVLAFVKKMPRRRR